MYHLSFLTDELVTVFILSFLGLALATLITPIYTTLAYRYKFWKKPRNNAITGEKASVFSRLHAAKHKRNIPTMAGVITLLAVAVVTIGFNWSREQTWLPLAAMAGAGLVGLVDDIINIRGLKPGIAGLRSSFKFGLITLV